MKRLIAAVVVSSIALLATVIVPGIEFHGSLLTLLVAGAIFGIFNAVVRPIALVLSVPALILTLGLFYFILNGLLLWLASFILPGYSVSGPVAGILGSVVVALVNWAVNTLFGGDRDRKRSK
jgi:putative membrane protein